MMMPILRQPRMGKGRRLPKAGLPTGKPAGVNKAAKPGGIVHYVKQRVHEIVRSLSFRKEVEDSSAATQCGWLYKKGEGRHSWKRRYFLMKDRFLSYYKRENDAKPLGQIDLNDCIKVCSAKSVSHVDGKESTLGIDLITKERTYHFIADNEVTKYEWIQVISERIFDYMAARRAESDAEGNAEDTATNDEEQET